MLGIEGSEALVARSRENYKSNQAQRQDGKALAATDFVARNLFEMTPEMLIADGTADKWLVDPPREGAFALAKALADIEQARIGAEGAGPLPGAEGWTPPKRIVYVSCNPPPWRAMRACWCIWRATAAWRRHGQHVPAHGARRKHGGV